MRCFGHALLWSCVVLVSTADPTQYVLGDSHGKGMNAVKLNELKNKFMPGLVFHMTHAVFADNMKKAVQQCSQD